MKKMFFVVLLAIVSMHSEANPIKGTGILRKAGSIELKTAQGLLGAFVTFDSVAVDGEDQSDIEYLSDYIRTDIPGYPLGKIRALMLDQLAIVVGVDPETDQLTEEEYFQVIDALVVKRINQSWWASSGYRSLYIHMDGTGKFGWWTPNRASEDILFLEDQPVFGLFCLNPIGKPIAGAVVDETDGPDEMVVNPPAPRRASRNSGGINTTAGTTGTGTNNSTSTATNTVIVHVENPPSNTATPVVVQEKRGSGLGNFLLGAALGYGANELRNSGYRGGFRNYGGGFSSRRGSAFSGGGRSWGSSRWGFSHRSSGFRPRRSTYTPSVRRYNTSSLSGIVPRNGR